MSAGDRYKLPEAMLAYLSRIGAEVLNFRRAMVKEYRGAYYVEKTLITINSDGSIDATREEHLPTDEEAGAIEAALKNCEFPQSIEATEAACKAMIAASGRDPDQFYLLWNRASNKVTMIQERVPRDDGKKWFRPHSLWSDNKWREMEPERKLPFWKPRLNRGKSKVMIHEGAKPARHIDWMLNDLSPEARRTRAAHPWAEELASYEHWGMIGGALAPHRSDYSEVKREQFIGAVYVCDNDWPGRSVLKKFSLCYSGPLTGVMFNNEFRESWDMADHIPKTMFHGEGDQRRFCGPSLLSLMTPATRATKKIPNPSGKGAQIALLLDAFAQEWIHTVSPETFIHRCWPHRLLSANEFNSKVRPYSDVDDTARLLRSNQASKSSRLHYHPGKSPGLSGDNTSGDYLNTHVGSDIKPERGDPQPFLRYVEKMIPDEGDRREVLRWCATLIAKPETKMAYGVLLVSEVQGVGKSTLGEKILAPLIGMHNVSSPSESDIVESQFNGWMAHKRLALVQEIYQGQSSKAYNRLKSVITDKIITVNRKHLATYEIENWLHIFACSNSPRALKLSGDDRRWLVPKVTEEKPSKHFWREFNEWLAFRGGLGIIRHWANEYAINDAVMPGANAPASTAKRAMIDEAMSPGETIAASLLDQAAEMIKAGAKVYLTDQHIVRMIKEQLYDGRHSDRLEKPSTIRRIARDRGWFPGIEKTRKGMPDGVYGRVLIRDPSKTALGPDELRKDGFKTLSEMLQSENAAECDAMFGKTPSAGWKGGLPGT